MASKVSFGLLLSSMLVLGCAGRTSDDDLDDAADTYATGEGELGDRDEDTGDDPGESGSSDDCGGPDCNSESSCEGDAPWCVPAEDISGTCSHGPYEESTCVLGDWECPEGFIFESEAQCVPECHDGDCAEPCEPGAIPPDECWDQGPGECADSTIPPSCTDGVWVCPEGWDFGGFGEGCTFPGE